MLHQLQTDLEDSQSDFKAETKRRMELELDCDLLKKESLRKNFYSSNLDNRGREKSQLPSH